MSDAVYDDLAQTLAEVYTSYGKDVLDNRRRLNGVLADRMPDAKREIRVVLDAIEDGVLKELETVSTDQVGMQVDRLATRMESHRGIRLDLAQQVIAACGYALGVAKLPSEMFGKAQVGQFVSQGREDDWVGVSQPVDAAGGDKANPTPQPPAGGDIGAKASQFLADLQAKFEGKEKLAAGVAIVGLILAGLQFSGALDVVGSSEGQVQVSFPQYDNDLGYFGEFAEFDVAATATLHQRLEDLTPSSIVGAETLSTQAIIDQGGPRSDGYVFVDTYAQDHTQIIPGALRMPWGGAPGTFSDEVQLNFGKAMETITKGSKAFPVIFYSKNVARWDGYNAALRATQAGYLNVFWYRGGIDSWEASGQTLQTVENIQRDP